MVPLAEDNEGFRVLLPFLSSGRVTSTTATGKARRLFRSSNEDPLDERHPKPKPLAIAVLPS